MTEPKPNAIAAAASAAKIRNLNPAPHATARDERGRFVQQHVENPKR